jgi:rubrerythrin
MAVEQFDPRGLRGDGPLFRFRCTGCFYGASRRTAPERCPMCGGSTWEYENWRPFSQLDDDLAASHGGPAT